MATGGERESPTAESARLVRLHKRTLVFGITVLLTIYALSATWTSEGQSGDAWSVALAGWNLAENGTLDLSDYTEYDAWLVQTENGWYSNRAPGLIVVAFLGYFLASPLTDSFVFWPATLIAVVTSGLAVALLAAVSQKLGAAWRYWPFVVIGLATSLWSIASDQLWPHGPAALMVALALWLLATKRVLFAGIALGTGLLIRPSLAIAAAVLGIGLAIYRKSPKPILQLTLPVAVAAGLYLAYNRLIFSSWSPIAAYEASGGLTTATDSIDYGFNKVITAFMSPRFGVLVWAPWIVVGIVALPRVWQKSPDWARLLPLSGALYLAAHAQFNRVSGGLPYNYRYAIEAVVLAAPLLILSLWAARENRVLRVSQIALISVAIGLQIAYTFVAECTGIGTASPHCALFGI